MSLTAKEVTVCNQACDRIGAANFTYAVQTSIVALKCNTHYEPTRDALLRSHDWPFARARKTLSAETNTPDFEWDYQFSLPDDYLRTRPLYRDNDNFQMDEPSKRCAIEGNKLMCNDETFDLKYIRKVTDPDEFDPLFKEVLVLQIALKLVHPVAGTEATSLKEGIMKELNILMPQVRAVDRQEMNTSGYSSWNLARFTPLGIATNNYPQDT